MLPKKNRTDKKTVEKIFKEGKFINSPTLSFKFLLNNNSSIPKISFVAPKSIARFAVKRNFLKRRGYSAIRELLQDFPLGITGVFIFKKPEKDVLVIKNEVKTILSKIN